MFYFRFIPYEDISLNIGAIENEKDPNISKFVWVSIFNQTDENKNQTPEKRTPSKRSTFADESQPSCSGKPNLSEFTENLYVNLPQETKKPLPTPRARPRKSRSTLDLTSTKHLSLYIDDTDEKATNYDQFSKLSTPEDSPRELPSNTKKTNGSPVKPLRRSNYYPTTPHRRKIHSVAISADELDGNIQYSDNSISNQQSSSYRVAPAPPLATKPTKKKPVVKPSGKNKYHTPKKAQAPLPPTVSSNTGVLKAEVLKVFEISKQGTKDFYASLQGVAMTKNYMAILDSDGQQIILFNTEGYYKTRFQVHIPNQGKINLSTSKQ